MKKYRRKSEEIDAIQLTDLSSQFSIKVILTEHGVQVLGYGWTARHQDDLLPGNELPIREGLWVEYYHCGRREVRQNHWLTKTSKGIFITKSHIDEYEEID